MPTIKSYGKAQSRESGLAYHLIPWGSIRRISHIFREGLEVYKTRALNATNLEGADDPDWLAERFNHAVEHLTLWWEGDTSEDHLAKVAWFCIIAMTTKKGAFPRGPKSSA